MDKTASQNPFKWHWLIASVATLAMLALTMLLSPRYQSNDDYTMSLIASGAFGAPDARLVFISVLLGKPLAWLYGALPQVNWYAWMNLSLIFFATSTCVWALLRRHSLLWGGIASVLFLTFVSITSIQIQYTQVAYLCLIGAFAAFITLGEAPVCSTRGWRRFIPWCWPLLLLLAGLMLRWKCIITLAPFFLLYALWRALKKDFRPTAFVLAALALVLGVFGVDAYAYRSDQWQQYKSFNSARAALLDYPKLPYYPNQAVFDQVGWSSVDYNMFYSWLLADEQVITTQSLQQLREQADPGSNRIPPMRRDIANEKRFWAVVPLLLAYCICLITRSDKVLPTLITGMVLGIHWLLLLTGRINVQWVVTPHYLLGLLLLLGMMDFAVFDRPDSKFDQVDRLKKTNPLAAVAVFMCLGLAMIPWVMAYSGNPLPDRQDYQAFEKLDAYTQQNMDKLFFSTVRVMEDQHFAYSIFQPPQRGGMLNRVSLGGWLARSPRYQQVMQAQGIDNALTALVRDHVYLIANQNIQLIQRYLQAKHGMETTAEVVWQQGHICIYKLRVV